MGSRAGAEKTAAIRRHSGRDEEGFTEKERAFVLHYIGAARRNATEAALLAGWGKGNRRAAGRYAYAAMSRPHLIAEIQRQTELRNERLSVTADDVLRELLVLKVDAERLSHKSAPALRTRLDVIKTIGDHVGVGAFRRQVGLSAPNGGPIETVDLAALAKLTDEELDQVARVRAILDRVLPSEGSDRSGDPGGAGAASEGA